MNERKPLNTNNSSDLMNIEVNIQEPVPFWDRSLVYCPKSYHPTKQQTNTTVVEHLASKEPESPSWGHQVAPNEW